MSLPELKLVHVFSLNIKTKYQNIMFPSKHTAKSWRGQGKHTAGNDDVTNFGIRVMYFRVFQCLAQFILKNLIKKKENNSIFHGDLKSRITDTPSVCSYQ